MPAASIDEPQQKLKEKLNLEQDFPIPSFQDWQQLAEKTLKGLSIEDCLFTATYEGITLFPLYTRKTQADQPADPNSCRYFKSKKETNKKKLVSGDWEICQEVSQYLPEEINRAILAESAGGTQAVEIILDHETLLGREPLENVRIPARGGSICTLNDMATVLHGVDLRKTALHIPSGFLNQNLLCLLAAYLKKQNLPATRLKGSATADPVGYLLANGAMPLSYEQVFNQMAQSLVWALENLPGIRTIGVSGLPVYEAGGSAVQELGFVMATAVEYLDQMGKRGIGIEDAAKSFRITLGTGPFYFMEMAKFRAARVLWAKVIAAFGGSEDVQAVTVHGRTSSYYQTRLDPHVNILRNTTASFAAIAGGADSLHTSPYDECFNQPDEFSRRIARNIQIILKNEVNLQRVSDPGGGAYYLEQLTREIINKAWQLFQQVEQKGGMYRAVISGFPQKQIQSVADLKEKDFLQKKTFLIGTNIYTDQGDKTDTVPVNWQALREERFAAIQYHKKNRKTESGKFSHIFSQYGKGIENAKLQEKIQAFLEGATIEELNHWVTDLDKDMVKTEKLRLKRLSEVFEKSWSTKNGADT